MRIAMVSAQASPLATDGGVESGGQNIHVLELSAALADVGHDVTVWTRRDTPALPDRVPVRPGVEVRHVTAGPAGFVPRDELVPHLPAFTRALDEAWTADPPDVVHGHYWMSGMTALAAAAGRFPVVATFHGLGSVKRRHRRAFDTSPEGRVGAEIAVARRADRVVATCSDEVFELARLGAPRRRMTVVPSGVDTTTFTPDGPAQPKAGRPRLVVLGRLVRRKGVDEVIEAMRRVPAAELVVGGGAGPADPDAPRLAEAARRVGVADRVRLIGPVPRAGVPALLRSADAVVCAPWYEPFGIVPLEAMACGRPVVASAIGGLQETVVDQVTGLLVPPRRPDALAAALRDLLGSPTMGTAYGIAGRDRVLARYGWERVAAGTLAVYQDVLDARTRTAAARSAHAERATHEPADLS